ncbi:MAG: efflux transporter outer membrane subunit [Acidobacteriota bacterium]|nr:efflux transporter outer membrane subunit [Acidobacteriota bacterium]
MNKVLALLASVALLLTGCMMGPNYKRPLVSVPSVYRGAAAPSPAEAAQPEISFGAVKWWTVFHDPVLQNLIRTSLKQNYDLRIAAARILQAEGELRVTRSQEFPQLSGTASGTRQKNLAFPGFPAFQFNEFHLGGTVSWLLDFWGQYRRATEAARASLLASKYNQQAVRVTLVSEVASAYFQLRELDLQLQISQDTLKSRQDSLRLTQIKQQGGVSSMLDVRQAQSLVQTAETTITNTQRLIAQQEDAISILLGENPAAIPRGAPLNEQTMAPSPPPGLPSSLLERRPDVRVAEEQLIAANAEIGVARAAFFPQISLTGTGGTESFQLSKLFSGGVWSFAGDLTQPVFTAGRLRGNLQAARAAQQAAVLSYQQTIQEAFREVSDALIGYEKNQTFLAQQQSLTQTLADADHIARIQYQGGVTAYLDVLTQETQYFTAQLALAQAKLNELDSVVSLYQVLGGGWQQ